MPSKVHVSRAQIDQFTFIVRLPSGCAITSSWLEEQQQAILDLPPSLLKSKNLAIRMIERFSHDRAELCYQHRKLNPLVIRKLFEYIQLECTTRMMPFEISPTAPKDLAIQQWRKRVIGINSLWTEKETFYHVHQAEKGDPIHQQVKGDCEACILATIGGDQQMLMDLYICANSRGRLDRRGQPICHIIEGWLDAMGILEHIYESTKPFYRLIRSERARMQRERRAERRVKNRERPLIAPGRPPRPEERQKMDDDAAEDEKSEIIDLYIKRLSAMNGQNPYNKQPNDSRLSLHPAIRSHIGFDAATGKYSRVNPEEVPHVPQIPPQHRENAGLGRSNTVISRDSRNDPGAYEVFRSDSPVSDDSRNSSPDPNCHRKKSKDDDQYSGSAYSRPSADQHPYDSGYQDSSSILSPQDRDHELNLRMNPTNADIGGPCSPISLEMAKNKKGYRRDPPSAGVQRNRQDAYSNLVGMPSAYEFAAVEQNLKTMYDFEPGTEDERKVEDKSLREAKTDRHQNRSVNTQDNQRRQGDRGRTHDKRAATGTSRQEHDSKTEGRKQGEEIYDAHERRNTDWGHFCRLSVGGDEPAVPNQRGERRDNKQVELGKVKRNGKGEGKENPDPVQRKFMDAFRKK